MPMTRTTLAALLVAFPAAALAQDATNSSPAAGASEEVGTLTLPQSDDGAAEATRPAADDAASRAAAEQNVIIDELTEDLAPREPDDGQAAYAARIRDVETVVHPGIIAQTGYDPAADRLRIVFRINTNHARTLDVPFVDGGFMLAPEAARVLDPVGLALSSPELVEERYLIAGHTADAGASDENAWLSERRAAEVRAYLVANHGIDPMRLVTVGFGDSMPRTAGAGLDERIEIVLLESVGEPVEVVVETPVTATTGNVVCDSQPVALTDPRPRRHNLDDFGSPRTPVECQDVHHTAD